MDNIPTIFGGWMIKKNQRRYFVLRDCILYWFVNEVNHRSDFSQSARGQLSLENCSLSMHPDRKYAIQLLVSTGEAYILHCSDDREARTWFNVLQKAIKDAYSLNQNGRLMKSDWLVKKNKRRYFVLQRGVLSWYLNPSDTQPKGSLDIKNCTLSPVINDDTFVITASYMNKEYRIICPNGIHQARSWVKVLTESLEVAQKNQEETFGTAVKNVSGDIIKSGWLEKKGQKRYFKLTNGVLAWYNQNPSERPETRMNGSLNLKGCQISQSGFTFHIRPAAGKIYVLKASTEAEAFGWVTALLSTVRKADMESTKALDPGLLTITQGWVIKKYMGSRKEDRRFIVLEHNKLKYYDREPYSGVSPKGEIFLALSQVSMMNATTFVIATGQGRDYPWQCSDAVTTQQWVNSIQFMIYQANEAIQKSVQKYQWLVGGRGTPGDRWVVISKDNKLLWFDHVMPPEHINEKDANGYLALQGVKVGTNAAKKLSFAIAAPRQAPLIWTCPDETSAESWVKAIHAAAKGQLVRDVMPKLVFGVPLAKLLEREGVEIPTLVTKCCTHIKQHGTDQVGIFRLSGRASEIDMFVEQFNTGADVTFSTANDVNAIAGLLKAFLREMPEPVFPFEFYESLLANQDPASMRNLVSRLPKPHYDLAKYLFGFLHHMLQYSAETKMDASNFAICVGPNVVRRKESENANGLAEFPQVLGITTSLIANFPAIFEGRPAASPPPPSDLPPPSHVPPPTGAPPPRPLSAHPSTGPPPSRPPQYASGASPPTSLPRIRPNRPRSMMGTSRMPPLSVQYPEPPLSPTSDDDPPPPEDDPEDPLPPDYDPTPPSPEDSPRGFIRSGGSPPPSPRRERELVDAFDLNDFTFLSSDTAPLSSPPMSPHLTQSGNYQALSSQPGFRKSAGFSSTGKLSGNYSSLSSSPGFLASNQRASFHPSQLQQAQAAGYRQSQGYQQPQQSQGHQQQPHQGYTQQQGDSGYYQPPPSHQ